jgi:hypothetical protein
MHGYEQNVTTFDVLLCMVAADGDPICVLAKCKELVRDFIRKSCKENFVSSSS